MTSKTFIKLFFGFFFVVLFLLEMMIRTVGKERNGVIAHVIEILSNPRSQIILGDSQTNSLFSNHLSDYSNLSLGGSNLEKMHEILKYKIQTTGITKMILIAAPQIFSEDRVKNQSFNFTSINETNFIQQYLNFYSPLILSQVPNVLKNLNKPLDEESRPWNFIFPSEQKKRILSRLKRQKPIEDYETQKKQYKELISMVKNVNGEVCLIKPPTVFEYESESQSMIDYKKADDFFFEVAQEFNIKLVKGSDLIDIKNHSLFRNQDHLIQDKTNELANRIAQECF